MNRRGFMGAILASGFAPAIAHAGILMPVKKIVVPARIGFLSINGVTLAVQLDQSGALSGDWAPLVRGSAVLIDQVTLTNIQRQLLPYVRAPLASA